MTKPRWPDDSSIAAFVKACKRAKGRNLVDELLDPFRLKAASGEAPDDVVAALKLFQVRPWYSAQELAWFWPLISVGIAGNSRAYKPDAAWLHKRLVGANLPRLKDWGGGYDYEWNGALRQYFIVQHIPQLSRLRFSQRDFERVMQDT